MITLAWQLLKVIICSGILYGYYYLALRNKIFHGWNRFYLLASILLALAVPLMKINIFQRPGEDKGSIVRMLQTINNSDDIIIEYSRNKGKFSSDKLIEAGYLLISIAFLSVFSLALYNIFRLRKKYPVTKLKGINFISTDAKGTPFSFFNSIFWNNAIDLHSKQGHQIFNHEIVHVKEKHSIDKIFMNLVLSFFWINPFFWLIQKELSMIHEFIADKQAPEDNDIKAFAEMVLQTVYPGRHFSITNNFFHSPLKRRLTMFTKNKNPKASYVSRLLVLPLAAFVLFAFTLKMKTAASSNHYSGKKITVVIDPGHGGTDDGAVENAINEKDLNLSIAKAIKELNKNKNLDILLSRSGDELMTPQDRVKFAEMHKADLFISIHMDAGADKNARSGVIIFIPKDDNVYVRESRLLGSSLIESFKNNYLLQVADNLQQREQGIWVLKANQYPSVLIEAGFLSNRADVDYLIKPENQETVAKNILDGIEKYALQRMLGRDTIATAQNPASSSKINKNPGALPDPLFIADGKIVSKDEALSIMPKNIETVSVLKGASAIETYGEKARNGVVEIITKRSGTNITDLSPSPPHIQSDSIPNPVFTKVEMEPEFPGGYDAWLKYIARRIHENHDKFTSNDFGTCLVKFIVNRDGSVSNVQDSTMKGTQLAQVAVDAIRTGPKWIPAKQNNQTVAAYRLQAITLTQPK